MSVTKSFRTKTALITGGSSGLGLALCRALKTAGAAPVNIDLHPGPDDTPFYQADVRDAAALAKTFAQIESDHGPIDLAIANAAIDITGEAHQFTAEDWQAITQTNLSGATNLIAGLYPKMVARREGQIILISSGAGLIHFPLGVPYTATKSALIGLASALRAEARTHNVHINVACPPIIDTPILTNGKAKPGIDRPAFLKSLQTRPLPADTAAQHILRGAMRNTSPIIFPASLRWSARVVAVFPPLRRLIQSRIVRLFDRNGRQ